MASVVATPDNTYGAMNVVVDTNAVTTSGTSLAVPQAVTLYRVMVDGTKTQVRGTPMFTSGGQAIAWDDEAPLQTPITYQAVLGLGTETFVDTGNRTAVSGWGSADTGQPYTTSGGTSNDYSVSGGSMAMVLRTVDVFRTAVVDVGTGNVDVSFDVSLSIGVTVGANVSTWVCARYVSLSNFYAVRLDVDNVGRVFGLLFKNVGGTLTQIGSTVLVGTGHSAGDKWRMRIQTNGSTISGMVWQPTQGPPSAWQFTTVDGSIAASASTKIAVLGWIQLGNTNTLPITATWDSGIAYDMTVTTALNANSSFESGVSPWVGINGAVGTRTTLYHHAGIASMLVTPDGVTNDATVQSEDFMVLPNTSYTLSGWLLMPANEGPITRSVSVVWKDASHTPISSDSLPATINSAGVWVGVSGTPISPSNAVFAQLTTSGSGVVTTAWTVDEVMLASTTSASQAFVMSNSAVITGAGGDIGWLKDPVIPANDIAFSFATTQRECITATGQIEFVSLSDETLASANGVFSIINDPRDADIAMLRKAPTMSLVVTSQELTDIPRLENIFASGRHLLLQLPTKYGWAYALFGSDYIRVADVVKGRIGLTNMARPERVWIIPIALARVPVSPTGYLGSNGIGVGKATWGQMAVSGLTYAQLNATGKTVLELSQGQGY